MNKLDNKIFKDIAIELAKSAPDWCGAGAHFDATQTPQVRSFGHSFIARYLITGSKPQVILVKIAHSPNQSDLQAALENESLRALAQDEMTQLQATWQAFQELGDPDLIAVQPLAYLPAWNAIVMFEVEGQTLRNRLVSPLIGFSQPQASAQLIQHLRKSSQWLWHYHNHVGGSQTGLASKPLMQARLDKISEDVTVRLGLHLDAPNYLSAIKSHMDTVSGMEPVAQLHGDFHCTNIIVTPRGQICVLDPRANSSRQSVYNELATLLIDMHLKPIPILTGGRFTQTFLDQSRQAIVESYFKPGEFSQSLLDFYCACEAIFKWSMDERDFIHRKNMRMLAPLARPILTRYMHQLVSRFLK